MQVDRNDDMLRSCLRAVDAISRIPDAESVASFKALLQVRPCVFLLRSTLTHCGCFKRMGCSSGPSSLRCCHFVVVQNTVRGGLLAPKFAAVQQERAEATGTSAMDVS